VAVTLFESEGGVVEQAERVKANRKSMMKTVLFFIYFLPGFVNACRVNCTARSQTYMQNLITCFANNEIHYNVKRVFLVRDCG
jgi:hypothetical protein